MNDRISWQQVPGWFNFDDVYQQAVDRAPPSGAHFVEVGVLFGKSALFMAEAIQKSGKKITFDAVDTFGIGHDAIRNGMSRCREHYPTNDHTRQQELLEVSRLTGHLGVAEHVVELSGLGNLINLVVASGQVHSQSYEDESLDFVFVDAQHTYDDTVQILRAFVPKLRRGGVLAGHDYSDAFPGVRRAVRDVLGEKIEVSRISFLWTK